MKKSKKSDLKSEQMSQFTIDNSNQKLTTNDGVSIYDNNNTLKVGDRGPVLFPLLGTFKNRVFI